MRKQLRSACECSRMDSVNQFFVISALIFFRLLPIIVVSPIMMLRRVPVLVRVILGVSLAIILAAGYSDTVSGLHITFTWGALISEFVIGMMLAFGFHAAHGSMQVMGHVIDQQIGFAAAMVFDPASEQMHSLIGELMVLIVLVTFLSLDIHHKLLLGIASTIYLIPLGQAVHINIEGVWQILGIQFAVAFALACPVILSLWLVDVILALASRSLPQANIYFVAMPVKIAIGLILVVWLTTYVLRHLAHMFELIFNNWEALF